jgi:hypothetical protein
VEQKMRVNGDTCKWGQIYFLDLPGEPQTDCAAWLGRLAWCWPTGRTTSSSAVTTGSLFFSRPKTFGTTSRTLQMGVRVLFCNSVGEEGVWTTGMDGLVP